MEDATFDAVICECAFCTFPDKPTAAREFFRTLKPGGKVGVSDLTRNGETPADLRSLLAWIACVADAQPIAEYERYLTEAGFHVGLIELHDEALAELVRDIQVKLLGVELLVTLKKIDLPSVSFDEAKTLARAAGRAVKARQFGYAILTASKLG